MAVYSLDYDAIKKDLISQGFDVTEVKVTNARTTIYFNCSLCHKPHYILYNNFKKGQNPKLYCKECQVMTGPKMERIKDYFNEHSVPITRVDTSKKHWDIYFPCAKCGTEVKILDDYVGKNNKELCCKHCREHTRVPKQKEVEALFEAKGAKLISKYESYHKPMRFSCSKCGREAEIDLAHFKSGTNPDLLCERCRNRHYLKNDLIELLHSKGSELLGEYTNYKKPVSVKCAKCGNPFDFVFNSYRWSGLNPNIYCETCRRELYFNKTHANNLVSTGRRVMDSYWYNYIKEFFNIPKSMYSQYNSHHIIRYIENEEYCTSICNGYPLLKELHQHNNKFYHYEDGRNQKSWGEKEKLPYHTYSPFEYLDLNSKIVTEFLFPTISMFQDDLIARKEELKEKGIVYVPIFLGEMATIEQREIVYSNIRRLAYRWFPAIYAYTGTELKQYDADSLEEPFILKGSMLDWVTNANRLQGSFGVTTITFALKHGSEVVAFLSVGQHQFSSAKYDWYIYDYVEAKNTIVNNGFIKLFKYFVSNYHPLSVSFVRDLRFLPLNDAPDEDLVACGFTFKEYVKPRPYMMKSSGDIISYSSSFNLGRNVTVYDCGINEDADVENMGLTKIFGCGSYRYVWHRPN